MTVNIHKPASYDTPQVTVNEIAHITTGRYGCRLPNAGASA